MKNRGTDETGPMHRVIRHFLFVCNKTNFRDKPIFDLHVIYIIEPRPMISKKCGILTSVDSDEPVQPPFKHRNAKCFSVSSLTFM